MVGIASIEPGPIATGATIDGAGFCTVIACGCAVVIVIVVVVAEPVG
jgi:hypothetical protein